MSDVPCIRLAHLTETQKRAYVIADNKLALNAGWDEDVLRSELEALAADDVGLEITGFDQDELDALFSIVEFEPGVADDQSRIDRVHPKTVTCPHCAAQFDVRQ